MTIRVGFELEDSAERDTLPPSAPPDDDDPSERDTLPPSAPPDSTDGWGDVPPVHWRLPAM